MPEPLAFLRVFGGLRDGSGRTVAVAGPPFSGKSALLAEARRRAVEERAIVLDVRGSYRDRTVPFAAVLPLEEAYSRAREEPPGGPGSEGDETPLEPIALGYLPIEEPAPARSSRGGRRRRDSFSLFGAGRPRSAVAPTALDFWERLSSDLRADPKLSVVLIVEDGGLIDPDSRDFILTLSERARLLPFAIFVALDTSLPSFAGWEERLAGRGDVDWVRFPRSNADPREAARLRELFEALPEPAQRTVGYTALLDGAVSEILLGRITRLPVNDLAEAILPAVEAGVLKLAAGRVQITHDPWIRAAVELIPVAQQREMHQVVAQALEALTPEPSLSRRLEIAEHYFAWRHGSAALRALSEAAEVAERGGDFDLGSEALLKALSCLSEIPPEERPPTEAELGFRRARALFYSGLPQEGERALRAALSAGLNASSGRERVEELIEEIIPALQMAGPRPSLLYTLIELSEEARNASAPTVEALLAYLLSLGELSRNEVAKAQEEAARAVLRARPFPSGAPMGLALLAVANARIGGTPHERKLALRFLEEARKRLSELRRHDLLSLTEEVHGRLLAAMGESAAALQAHEHALPTAHRLHLVPLELYHHLGIAETLLDTKPGPRVGEELRKARSIIERLRLLPPSPPLLRLWLLEGRWKNDGQHVAETRDLLQAVIARTSRTTLPTYRAEALLRLAELDSSGGSEEAVSRWMKELADLELAEAVTPAQAARIARLRGRGAGAFPPPFSARPALDLLSDARGEEAGEERVEDRSDPHRG